MVTTALQRSRLLFAMAMITAFVPCVAEARHWRHHGYYGYYGYDRGQGEDVEKKKSAPRNGPSLGQTYSFGAAIARMIQACEEESAELKKTPFDVIARTIRPNASQRDALEQIRTATFAAADTLSATCPKDIPAVLSERLDALTHALQATMASRDGLRASLANFYATLDDEQKARVVVNIASSSQPTPDQTSRSGSDLSNEISDEQDSVCRRWAATLRSWPVKKIESEMALSDEQHAALYEVAAAMYHAAGGLSASCSDRDRLTPSGRLETQQMQVEALRRRIHDVQPVLTKFQNLLSDPQKARLGKMVDESPTLMRR